MTNQPNVFWPGWEVVRLIGRGSFGAVYEIQRTLFDDVEKAALKVISIPPATTFADNRLWSFAYWEPAVPETAAEDGEFRAVYVAKKDETKEDTAKSGFGSLFGRYT